MEWKNLKEKLIKSKYHYFHTDNGILLCGDCLEIMKEIPEGCVDLVLTDPPYNIAVGDKLTKVGSKIKSNKEAWGDKFKDYWDSLGDYGEWLVDHVGILVNKLCSQGSLIVFLGRTYTGYFIYLFERELNLKFRNKLYFEKVNPLPHFRKNNYRSTIEEAVWFTKTHEGNYYFNFLSQREMKQIFKGSIGKKATKHPTEKYSWMIEPLIERHSNEGHIVLDPFFGGGTTGAVCEKLGRKWIGIEKEKKYCEISKKRILEIKNGLER